MLDPSDAARQDSSTLTTSISNAMDDRSVDVLSMAMHCLASLDSMRLLIWPVVSRAGVSCFPSSKTSFGVEQYGRFVTSRLVACKDLTDDNKSKQATTIRILLAGILYGFVMRSDGC